MATYSQLENDFILKIVVFGDSNVGKTTLTKRLATNMFSLNTKKTIGVDFLTKEYILSNLRITLQLWDFSGEERFQMLLPRFLKGSEGGVFVFDLTKESTLDHIDNWLSIVNDTIHYDFPIIMIGTKADLEKQKIISNNKITEISNKHKFPYYECSSKTGLNVDKAFYDLAIKIYSN